MSNYNVAILGAAFGDEAKAAITHYFSPQYEYIIRFGGGKNAGHSVYRNGKKYVNNLVPSVNWNEKSTKAFIASGVFVDLEHLCKEIKILQEEDREIPNKIYVDPDCFIVTPEHIQEDIATNSHLGTTNRGIGPANLSKMGRKGIRIRNILNSENQFKVFVDELKNMGVNFKGILELRNEFMKSNLLFEGSQSVLLDLNAGTYPFVSCGDATVSGIYSCGFHFVKLDQAYGIVKAYSTRVGAGPFPTEMFNDDADTLRQRGKEFGATTGRPRRIGWLDLPALNYAIKRGGITNLIISKFDVLDGMEQIKICTDYQKEPTCSDDFFSAVPQYITMSGWQYSQNIEQIQPFVDKVEKLTGLHVEYTTHGVQGYGCIKHRK